MKHYIIIHNVLENMVKKTNTNKIIERIRFDRYHTKIIYQGLTDMEVKLTERYLSRKLIKID